MADEDDGEDEDEVESPWRVAAMTCPRFVFLPRACYDHGSPAPPQGPRLRPHMTLDLPWTLAQLRRDVVHARELCGRPWAVLSVYSPYSHDLHVMLMDSDPRRYLPSPERLSEAEGARVCSLAADVVDFAETSVGDGACAGAVHVGYNWSPRSWGSLEEQIGFQSIPTKFHLHAYTLPDVIYDATLRRLGAGGVAGAAAGEDGCIEWVDMAAQPVGMRRILGDNDYVRPLSAALVREIARSLEDHSRGSADERDLAARLGPWQIDPLRGAWCEVSCGLARLLRHPAFFASFLRPLAMAADKVFKDLCHALTNMDCDAVDSLLCKVEEGPLPEAAVRALRDVPQPRPVEEARRLLGSAGYDPALADLLMPYVQQRAVADSGVGDEVAIWRKGFGYGVMLACAPARGRGRPPASARTTVHVLPGCLVGPGGHLETMGIVLSRPAHELPAADALSRSQLLWRLGDHLDLTASAMEGQ